MGKRVLIVDDMESVRMLLAVLLQDSDFEFLEAGSGEEALIRCTTDPPPDIVLLDLFMPRMDGIQCCREIKALSRQIKVVMLTTVGEEAYLKKAEEAGCDGYVIKPFRKAALLETLQKYAAS